MKEIRAKITSKGQVTIPREVRDELSADAGDHVLFVIDDGDIRVRAERYTLESVIGSVPPLSRPTSDDFDVEIEEAFEEEMDRKMRRWNGE